MPETVTLKLKEKNFEIPVISGTENEKALDIRKLRQESSYLTYDPGYGNTGACTSAVTYLDGEIGILRHRGIPIEQLAEKSSFLETSYLLIYGDLPTKSQLEKFKKTIAKQADLNKDFKNLFASYPKFASPMAVLVAMVSSLAAYYPDLAKSNPSKEDVDELAIQLLSKMPTICAYIYKTTLKNESFVEPRKDLDYVSNFLHLMFSSKKKEYPLNQEVVEALETLLILHADHEQNCSTSTVRMVGSSWADLFASISGGICALSGPLHGGANQEVMEMLEAIHADGGNIKKYVSKAKDPKSDFRLMGFGHRVYKNYDPRAKIIKRRVDDVLKKLGVQDPLLEIAWALEKVALEDSYFIERKLYPNVDFYSGIIYKAIGIPTNMFPVMFAMGRLPGWIAHWKEMKENPETKIGRPRQIYVGKNQRDYIPLDQRT
ncbi:MAG: citrate synthase [Candidatus Omnitrophica bacterium]|nr:citrate synthase [Candidatus Omnitrophota bacterium]